MIIEKLGSFKLPAWNTMIYTTFSFSPDSIFQWFSVTYTHFILTLRHGNRCDKSAGCHTDARTRGMLAVVVQLRHMLHTATAGVPHAWGWVEEGPGCPELPPPHFPLVSPWEQACICPLRQGCAVACSTLSSVFPVLGLHLRCFTPLADSFH